METWTPDDETVGLLIERYGLPFATGALTFVARGSMGRVWRLDLAEPTAHRRDIADGRLMLKHFLWGVPADAESRARSEAAFGRVAAAAGVTLTQSLAATDGTYVQRVPTPVGEVVLRLNTWAAGRPLRATDSDRAEFLGRTLGTLHALRQPTEARPDPYTTVPPGDDAWALLRDRVHTSGRIPELARRLTARLPELAALGRSVDTRPPQDLIFSHRDLKPANVLQDASGRRTVIDWDESGPISPDRELAAQLCVWHVRRGVVDRDRIGQTVRSYRDAGGYADVDTWASFSWRLANDLNYLHDEALAAIDDDLPEELREHAESEAERRLADFPTRSTLDQIIDAARI